MQKFHKIKTLKVIDSQIDYILIHLKLRITDEFRKFKYKRNWLKLDLNTIKFLKSSTRRKLDFYGLKKFIKNDGLKRQKRVKFIIRK